MDEKYDFREIEKKWQARWEQEKTFRAREEPGRPKFYALEMFPYPSGAGLSVGHIKNYGPADAYCRFKSMKGFNVLHPMGWDAFGQPAENEAIKRQRNPREMVPEYAASYKKTLQRAGCSYDWDREINSSLPEYYKWTQWIFLQLYKRDLAFRATAPINWCPTCQTGLANEEVKEGRCWRCDTPVEKRPLPQWYFRITAYADRLLNDLDTIQWPEGVKQMQRKWIGRSEGAEVDFRVESRESGVESRESGVESRESGVESEASTIRVFTTRPDTLWGATFMVLAPEYPLVPSLTTPEQKAAVDEYIRKAKSITDIDRMNAERTKTGVFTGAYAENPVNGERIPIWIADYVLMGYGTGAIMAVPAHDKRDFEFARKFDIPVRLVYHEEGGPESAEAMTEAIPDGGVMVNSGQFDGLPNNKETVSKVIKWLEETGKGEGKVNYKLRDWLISRQRYWGAPIPIIHCANCGEVPVPDDQLPVLLPDVENYQPSGTGESPLANIPEFVNVTCPTCGGPGRRETDTMGGFACSSWYFLRFADPHNSTEFASRDKLDFWLPVDMYTGGVEHAVMHLLYARFWTKVLYDAGLIGFTEPFKVLRNQGSMLAWTPGRRPRAGESAGDEDDGTDTVLDWIVLKPEELANYPEDQVVWRWARMSKSRGNVVSPDVMCNEFGADSLRIFEMFVAPFEDEVQWSEDGINGAFRFVSRVWRWIMDVLPEYQSDWKSNIAQAPVESKKVRRKLHQSIQKVGEDIDNFRFNTAIASLMELVNELYAYRPIERTSGGKGTADPVVTSEALENLVLLMAPFAPHLADEVWSRMGKEGSAYHAEWPEVDAVAAMDDEITLIVQVNGKVRDKLVVPADTTDDALKQMALASEKVVELLEGKQIRNVVVVPRKLINIVIG